MSYKVVYGKDITPDLLLEAVALDTEAYPFEYQRGSADFVLSVHERNEFVYTVVVDEDSGRVAGYCAVLPLNKKAFDGILSEVLSDDRILIEDVSSSSFVSFHGLYVASVVVSKEFRSCCSVLRVILDILYQCYSLYDHSVKIVADAVSPIGCRVCSLFGLKRKVQTERGSVIYANF